MTLQRVPAPCHLGARSHAKQVQGVQFKGLRPRFPPSAGDGFDWVFLAMAHWQLGAKEEGRKWYERAVGWMEERDDRRGNDELRRFRGEAAELLKPGETITPTPK